MQQQKQNIEAPHVSYSVTELAAAVSLRRWSNLKVKVIGVLCTVDEVKRTVALHEVGIPHNPVLVMTFPVVQSASQPASQRGDELADSWGSAF
ncbi:hypothetical protein O3P69_016050 [Scylla paramamosain]|uniref:Uncharacterized protein n=1 Tax=Scylla paramamosain TaxID=85552 RepID=A0AAW0TBG2_SCYPA